MKTWLQLLRMAFWIHPLQRALTVVGALVCVTGLVSTKQTGGATAAFATTALGFGLLMFLPMTTGGALFRMLVSRRTLLILPHAKSRLLAGFLGVTGITVLLWLFVYFLAFLPAPPRFKPDAEAYSMMFVLTFSFATQCTLALFVASRGPVWALVILLAWQVPAVALRVLDVQNAPQLLAGPVGLAMLPLAWIAFGIWFMRARHINRSAWGGGADKAASQVPATREAAMQYWLFGANTPQQLCLRYGAAAAALVVVQWFIHSFLLGGDNPRAADAMMFGTLSLSAVFMGAVSIAIAARARSLWLVGGRQRLELHAWCERQMLRMVLATVLPFLAIGLALWLLLPELPQLPAQQLFLSMLAPGLAAAWFGLMQQHQRSLFDALAAAAIVVGWYYGLARPLIMGAAETSWGVIGAQFALVVLLREVAQQRWRGADWRRTRA